MSTGAKAGGTRRSLAALGVPDRSQRQLANSLLPYWRLPAKYLDAKCTLEHRPERDG
ncbi:MAG: hypothetical protein HY858_06745 [Candidatus Solibacter usitatus]|nr:hypothetical protein [Candidatus Solibacter usitatus]